MKRSELTVGAELYYARPYEWKNDRPGDRVVVIAKEKTGTGVLVDRYREYGASEKPNRTVVPLGHLRGTYAEIKAEVEKRSAEKRKANKERSDRQVAAIAAAIEIVERANSAGYSARMNVEMRDGGTPVVKMTPETLAEMLDAIEKGK